MKINFNDKQLKEYFEAFDKEMLKKIYDDAVTSVEKKGSESLTVKK